MILYARTYQETKTKEQTNLVWKFLHTLLKISMSAKIFILSNLTFASPQSGYDTNFLKRLQNYQISEQASLFLKVTLAIEMY